jgi:hypothetical protein
VRYQTGLLLIETFRKLFNPQIEGHLDHLQVAFFLVRQAWRVARKRHLIGCGG